jgi:hypothetical protein
LFQCLVCLFPEEVLSFSPTFLGINWNLRPLEFSPEWLLDVVLTTVFYGWIPCNLSFWRSSALFLRLSSMSPYFGSDFLLPPKGGLVTSLIIFYYAPFLSYRCLPFIRVFLCSFFSRVSWKIWLLISAILLNLGFW